MLLLAISPSFVLYSRGIFQNDRKLAECNLTYNKTKCSKLALAYKLSLFKLNNQHACVIIIRDYLIDMLKDYVCQTKYNQSDYPFYYLDQR